MCMAAHNTVTLRYAHSKPSGPKKKHALNAFFSIPSSWIITYHIYLRILSNSTFTHITQCSSELSNQQDIPTFMYFVPCIVINLCNMNQ